MAAAPRMLVLLAASLLLLPDAARAQEAPKPLFELPITVDGGAEVMIPFYAGADPDETAFKYASTTWARRGGRRSRRC